ncbi:MAG TPA: polysaccharide deacetylase family protein [Gemmatimonadales bacterium]|nr:polysaccharide deacetylase family protein [Gemmatimonadales bacterium]
MSVGRPTPTDHRPLASVSLDVDDLWSYLKTHGDPAWERRPSYLPTFFPLALDALDELGIAITFFIVGLDAAAPANAGVLREVTARGHEVGNHSYEHEPWLHLYPRERIVDEIARAEQAIEAATGQRPVGFRGPGYSWSPDLLEVLAERGYLFDASTLPTYLGPLARTYYFWTAKLSREERETRRALFGTLRDGLRPVRPYAWTLPGGRALLEIPVTTMPVAKVPFHLSYLLYLARVSEPLMWAYFRTALAACRLTGTEPSFLLHPLDLLGGDVAPDLAFFPGMDLPTERKRRLFRAVLGELGRHYRLVPMGVHARALLERRPLEARRPVPAASEA